MDEKSVLTYVSAFYHCFTRTQWEHKGQRKVAKVWTFHMSKSNIVNVLNSIAFGVQLISSLFSTEMMSEQLSVRLRSLTSWTTERRALLDDRSFLRALSSAASTSSAGTGSGTTSGEKRSPTQLLHTEYERFQRYLTTEKPEKCVTRKHIDINVQ